MRCLRAIGGFARKLQLLSCAGCLLAKYCSKDCQKQDWKSAHKNRCHLFEADRKLSTVFAKSLGPGTINNPNLSLADKVIQWNFLNVHNHLVIACAALKNNKELAAAVNVGIFIRLVEERTGSKYDNRTFIIERVALFPRETSDEIAANTTWKYGNVDPKRDPGEHCKMLVGYCVLPNGKMADTQLWSIPTGANNSRLETTILPRISIFIGTSPTLTTPEYGSCAFNHHLALSGLKGQGRALSGHVRVCAPGETDSDGPAAYKKLLTDPSRIVKTIAEDLDALYWIQDTGLRMTEKRYPID
ncbi:hypothetical protein B0H13DRAFT_2302772 [Mycena leptocephala]|nr:hypothetical protein B0H13DRAFT_2302772 [Mycena leptocephala]